MLSMSLISKIRSRPSLGINNFLLGARSFCIETEYAKEVSDIEKDYEERMKRRQAIVGVVISTKCAKSITIQVAREKYVSKYKAWVKVKKKFMAHDEYEVANMGDKVRIIPCRPMSKKKRHALIDIIKKANIFNPKEIVVPAIETNSD